MAKPVSRGTQGKRRAAPVLRMGVGEALRELDWWMVGIATVSLLAHGILMVVLHGYDPPRRPDVEDIPLRAAAWLHTSWPDPKTAPPPPAQSGSDPVKVPVNHALRTASVAHPATVKLDARGRARAAVAAIVGHMGDGGTLRDLIRNGGSFADAERVLLEANGVSVGQREGSLAIRGGDSPRVWIVPPPLGRPLLPEVSVGERNKERGPRCPNGLCAGEPPVIEEGGCDAAPIAGEIRRHRSALVACYEKVMKHTPGVAGKLVLSLSIGQTGRVTEAQADSEGVQSEELVQCIESSARSWIFASLDCPVLRIKQTLVFAPAN